MSNLKLQVSRAAAVIPNDGEDILFVGSGDDYTRPCVLYIGGSGDLKVMTEGGDVVVFFGLNAGQFLPVNVLRVYATDTTATNMVALW